MKKMKTAIAVSLVAGILSTSFVNPSAVKADGVWISTADKFYALQKAGIMSGEADGQPHLQDTMTRAELATVLFKIFQLKEVYRLPSYLDTKDHWADRSGVIEAVTDAKMMSGKGGGKFDPDGKVRSEEAATALVKAFKLTSGKAPQEVYGKVSPWAQDNVAAALSARIIYPQKDYTKNALRSELIDDAYEAYTRYSTQKAADDAQKEADALTVTKSLTVDKNHISVTFSDNVSQTFQTEDLPNGQEKTVKITYKNKAFDVKAKWEAPAVTKIVATTSNVSVDAGKGLNAPEYLGYTLYDKNGVAIGLPEGTKLEFTSAVSNVGADGSFNNALNPLSIGQTFEYTVALKDASGKSVKSDPKMVTVSQKGEGVIPTELNLVQTDTGELWQSGNISVANDGNLEPKVRLIVTKAMDFQGHVVDQYNGAQENVEEKIGVKTYLSSNNLVALVDGSGAITPISSGQADIVVRVGAYEKRFPLWINPKPIPNSTLTSEVNVTNTLSQLQFSLKNQFNEILKTPIDLTQLAIKTKSGNANVVDLSAATKEFNKGVFTIKNAVLRPGTDSLVFRYGTRDVYGEIRVNVTSAGGGAANSYALVPENTVNDLTLDVYQATDSTLDLGIEKYINGTKIGLDTEIALADYSAGWRFSSSDEAIATVNDKTGIVTAVKEGDATIALRDQSNNIKAQAQIKILNTAPKITNIKYASGRTQIELNGDTTYTLEEILAYLNVGFASPGSALNRKNGKLTGAEFVSIKNSTGDLIIPVGDPNAIPVIRTPKIINGDRVETLALLVKDEFGAMYYNGQRVINNYTFDLVIHDKTGPVIAKDNGGADNVAVSSDIKKIVLTFDEPVYGNRSGGEIQKDDFNATFTAYNVMDGNELIEITSVGHGPNSNVVVLNVNVQGTYSGDSITIKAVNDALADKLGNKSTAQTTVVLP